MTGTIYKLHSNNGYGFIKGDDEPDERFFHAKWCEPIEIFSRLQEGHKVTFEPDNQGKGGNKLQAKRVRKAND